MIKKINKNNFKAFGRIIDSPANDHKNMKKNLFGVVLKEPGKTGWRIAYLVVREKVIRMIEQHPDTFESFEPVKGRSLLFTAHPSSKDDIECFLLDKPVILNKGVWHGIVTLDKESEVKLTENAEVKCIYRKITPRPSHSSLKNK